MRYLALHHLNMKLTHFMMHAAELFLCPAYCHLLLKNMHKHLKRFSMYFQLDKISNNQLPIINGSSLARLNFLIWTTPGKRRHIYDISTQSEQQTMACGTNTEDFPMKTRG